MRDGRQYIWSIMLVSKGVKYRISQTLGGSEADQKKRIRERFGEWDRVELVNPTKDVFHAVFFIYENGDRVFLAGTYVD